MTELMEKLANYQSLLFDLDDTLFAQADYDRGAFKAIGEHFSASYGLNEYLCQRKRFLGPGYPHLFDDAIAEFKLGGDALRIMLQLYKSHDGCYIEPQRSLQPQLLLLKQAGKQIFVISNGHQRVQMTKLERLMLHSLVDDVVICSAEHPERLKPAPWSFTHLQCRHLLSAPVMIGDNLAIDGTFASNCAIPFIHFCYRGAD